MTFYVFNDLEFIPGSSRIFTDPPELHHLVQFGTSSTRARGQDDMSSNKLPQINTRINRSNKILVSACANLSGPAQLTVHASIAKIEKCPTEVEGLRRISTENVALDIRITLRL